MEIETKNTQKTDKKNFFDRLVTIILLAVVLILAFLIGRTYLSSGSDQNMQKMPQLRQARDISSNRINVSVQTIEPSTFSVITTIGAEIEKESNTYSLNSTVSGIITKLLVSKDQSVNEGDIIAYVDPSTPGAKYKEQAVTSQLTGSVTNVPVYVGQTISTSTAIATIEQNGDLYLSAVLPEKYLSSISEGMSGTFTTTAWPDDPIDASIYYISNTVDPSNRTFEIKLSIDQDPRLKSGMFVTLSLITEQIEDAISIPSSAIGTYLSNPVVYIVSEGKAVRKSVKTGITENGYVVIESGLKKGDSVVIKGTVTDGSPINIVD